MKYWSRVVKLLKEHFLFIYLFCSLLFVDIVFRLSVNEHHFTLDYFLSFLFLLTVAFLIYFIGSFFEGKIQFLVTLSILCLITCIYISQYIYYQFFKTFYSFYSVGNGAQAMEFWKDTLTLLFKNIFWLLLISIPIVLFIYFKKKYFVFRPFSWKSKAVLLGCVLSFHFSAVGAVAISNQDQNTAHDFYFNNSSIQLSTERLGLLTSMRIDFQRLLVGWSPELKLAAPIEPPLPVGYFEEEVLGIIEKPAEKIVEYNVMKINFEELIDNETDEEMKQMHGFFQQVIPTEKNDNTGKYKDYNLILMTAEGFSPYAVHPEATPTLYKMVHEGTQFTDFYTPLWGVSTSDGEYVALMSLIPKSGVWSFKASGKNSVPFVMGNQLQGLGYKTNAYHNHTYTYYARDISHPNMGYDYKGLGNGLDVKPTWPESDLEMLELTVPEYIAEEPFHAYYMTVSGHMQYNFFGNYIAMKNRELVADLPYSEQARAYLATQIELDRALEHLLNELELAGVADRTLIAISADHYPYGLEYETIDELVGHEVERNFELYKSTFILYAKGMEPEVIAKPASSLDILPTLSNLMGLDYDSRLLMGRDIFSDAEPLVVFSNRSFITDKGRYNAVTKEFTANDGVELDEGYIDYISSIVQSKFYYSAKILETDYYGIVFGSE